MSTTRDWVSAATQVATAAGIPPALLLACIERESGGDPAARRGEPQQNDASVGLCQLLLGTARTLGYTGAMGTPAKLDGLFNPETNLTFAAKFWADLWAQFGGAVDRCASAYNGGDRPSLGFGTRATADVVAATPRVCLEHDEDSGACVKWRDLKVGEFGNQPYVSAFVASFNRWAAELGDAPAADAPTDDPTDDAPPGVPSATRSALGCAVVVVASFAAVAIAARAYL